MPFAEAPQHRAIGCLQAVSALEPAANISKSKRARERERKKKERERKLACLPALCPSRLFCRMQKQNISNVKLYSHFYFLREKARESARDRGGSGGGEGERERERITPVFECKRQASITAYTSLSA